MGTTDSNGIYFYEDTDGAPVASLLNVGQQSVSNAITDIYDDIRPIAVVANLAQRTALVATYAPSPTKPLYVHQQDQALDSQFLVTTNGTDFRVIPSISTASRWVNIDLYATAPNNWVQAGGAVGAPASVYLSDGWVKARGLVMNPSGGSIVPGMLIGRVPDGLGLRPTTYSTHVTPGTVQGNVSISIQSDGWIRIVKNSGFAPGQWLDLTALTWPATGV